MSPNIPQITFLFFAPIEALRPYIRHYLHLKAAGSTELMGPPPEGTPNFVDCLHCEQLLPTIGGKPTLRERQYHHPAICLKDIIR